MEVLSIGNSFSQDAQAYLKGVCNAQGIEITCVNLFIGGCSLIRHYENMKRDVAEYSYQVNGGISEATVSIKEALLKERWDVVTFQESSLRATELCHFEPYLGELVAYVRGILPEAKIAIHQTWGYDKSKLHAMKQGGAFSSDEMFDMARENYLTMFEKVGADIFIPSGLVLKRLYNEGYTVHSDGQHASLGIGRYALALTWMKALFGAKATGNSFRDFSAFVSREEIEAAQAAVDELV